ncbi:MHS family MFS transporter [Ursidibacter maritimus]|uniref:MHS family MFS transporter n=1 Tax=Ursidibacter maritimus TaxID=1331689 RepID=A0A949WI51_9PAST|nr:MFS transporter [Ursidibacter maritimus]KAE9538761.1 transporter [Ursidibacter maritimus]MBV6523381.1 MHS family MFS transporter [Ursidibacter maritimus]MBV6526456.1 MHS family MFS transporter [Ursidibacter maritimus]MBV6527787.1 MHS family MFS transporter [Ursidibacter maritimus]MBV6529808.1 MHS family MFS transporter [Ursidibacter maritimus]
MTSTHTLRNDPKKVAIASMIGTAIEFFDYYIYAAAAVLVFNTQFFKSGDPVSDELFSLSTLALAFFARPIGSALFGHFGDKIGRKRTLVASLLLMGLSTVTIGLLPNYESIGIWATVLLCLCRIGQGIGLGGEWGGAALVATENAPDGKRAWYGTFPQLGAPIGLFLANGAFFLVSYTFGKEALVEWAWRIPFISSIVLVAVGLWVRLTLHESHVFREAEEKGKTQKAPVSAVFKHHMKPLILGTFIMTATYVLFYIMTAFAQVYSRTPVKLSEAGHPMGLGIEPNTFTGLLLLSAIVFGTFVSISGIFADKIGRRKWLIYVTAGIGIFGLCMPYFLSNGTPVSVFIFLVIGMSFMGMTFGPMAALLPELFPTEVRYSGASLAYNFASIVGATIAATFAIKINAAYGILGVGIYLAINALITLLALFASKETKNLDLTEM